MNEYPKLTFLFSWRKFAIIYATIIIIDEDELIRKIKKINYTSQHLFSCFFININCMQLTNVLMNNLLIQSSCFIYQTKFRLRKGFISL
jgi:hypothetical protein